MEDLRVYVVDPEIGVGAWFEMPVNLDEVRELIGQGNDYVIRNWDLPFEVDEDMPLEEVNRLCELLMELPQYVQDEFLVLLGHFDGDIEYLYENSNCIKRYSDCETIADVMSLYRLGDGTYIETGHGVYEIDR